MASVDSLADAMKMLFVLHWICNVSYCGSTKCIFKMIERFGNIKGEDKFSLGNRPKEVLAEVTNHRGIKYLYHRRS